MSVKYKELTDKAFALHQNGMYDEAEAIYKILLEINPDDVNVLNLMGMLLITKKDYDNAITYLTRAVVLKDMPCFIVNLAKAYYYQNDYNKAIKLYNKALEKEEDDDTYYSLALLYKAKGDIKASLNAYSNAVRCNPENYNAHYNLALTYKSVHMPEEALKEALVALKLRGNDVDLYTFLSNLYQDLGEYSQAIDYLSRATVLSPKIPVYYYNLGVLYSKIGENQRAIECYNQALTIDSEYIQSLVNLAYLYKDSDSKKSFNLALKAYQIDNKEPNVVLLLSQLYRDNFDNDSAIKILNDLLNTNGDNPEVYAQLAVNYMDKCEYNSAFNNYNKAAELDRKNLNYYYGIALALKYLGRADEALTILENIYSQDNSNIQTAIALGMAYLTQKRFLEGMKLYSKRSLDTKFPLRFKDKIWSEGDDLKGKNILLYCDCGLGDTIMFLRYIPILKNIANSVTLQTDAALIEIVKQSFPYLNVINKNEEFNDYDIVMPVMDISYALNSDFSSIPYSEGYLIANNKKIKSFEKKEIFNTDKLKVGLFYQGNKRVFKNRYCPTNILKKLLNNENAQFYSFQIENDELKSDKIISLKKYIKDYTDTAALLKNIDILVTADSSIAHAAGALGIKTYLMLPKIPEWRWFNDDKNTPWYKSIKIFKENDKTGWAGVISRISREITKYANK